MTVKILDSSTTRNPERITVSEGQPATLYFMPANATQDHDTPLSRYVRLRIAEHVTAYRTKHGTERGSLKELVDRSMGLLSGSAPAMVKRGSGVGPKTAAGFARAFGFSSAAELQNAASARYLAQHHDAASTGNTPDMQKAIDAVIALGQGTPEQVATIVAAYAAERFRARDYDWWLMTLLAELKADAALFRTDASDRKATRKKQRKIRAVSEQKRAEPADSSAPPSVRAHAAPPRKRA